MTRVSRLRQTAGGKRLGSGRAGVSVAVVLGVLALMIAGCGATATSKKRASGPSASSLAYVNRQVQKYEAIPQFVPPGPPVDAAQAKGDTWFSMPNSCSIVYDATIDGVEAKIAAQLGINFQEYCTANQVSQWVQGVGVAISRHVNLFNLSNAPSPYELQPQLAQLQAAGIKTMMTHFLDQSASLPPHLNAMVPAPFNLAGRLMADYVIAKTKGHAVVLNINSPDLLPSKPQSAAMDQEFKTYCGSGCKVITVNIPSVDWATQIQSTVESYLHRYPQITYVVPNYDSEVEWVVPAITAVGHTGKVHVVTFNGTPFVLNDIEQEQGSIVQMDLGEDLSWLAYADIDQGLRLLTGAKTLTTENTPLRMFTAANVAQAGTPPVVSKGFGGAFVGGYLKLWGVKG